MIKRNKWMIVITSLITISPMFVGLLLWNRLPEEIATHFGRNNVANGWSSKPFAVVGLPLFLLMIHLLCTVATANDPKWKNINSKLYRCILWITPIASLIVCLSCYTIALGYTMDVGMITNIMVGLIFVIMGNFMHKVKQNYTVGIKIPWTLSSEENWNRTHRLASWLWVLCGIIMMLNSILRMPYFIMVIIFVAIAPMIYSFVLYKRGI